MCGIAGIYAYRDSAPPVDREELVLRVRNLLRTRELFVEAREGRND